MFKATHKRRATTLSKTLLTAGLLGGAALSTLGAGSAQADGWSPAAPAPGTTGQFTKWEFTTGTGTDPYNYANGTGSETDPFYTSPLIGDKKVTLLKWVSIPGVAPFPPNSPTDLEFRIVPASMTPWHVDLDFNPDDTGINAGSLTYKIQIVDEQTADCNLVRCDKWFDKVVLNSGRDIDTTITKIYGTGYDSTTDTILNPIDTLLLATNATDTGYAHPPYTNTLYVKDSWTTQPGNVVDNLANQYSQVPAPLPLLGVGAAFGSIRKLRKFSSQLKTFSMG
jgi:hypothetical protein